MMSIEQMQLLLGYLGYYDLRRRDGQLAIDGISGAYLRKAIKNFQSDHGIIPSGNFGSPTEKAILKAIAEGERAESSAPPPPVPGWTGSIWDDPRIKPYFKRSEFACPCPRCGGFPAEPAEDLVWACVEVREAANKRKPGTPFIISSGVRCQAHNDELPGSVPDSRHVRGRAVDFSLPGFTPAETKAIADANPRIVFSYIMASGWVHMDIGN